MRSFFLFLALFLSLSNYCFPQSPNFSSGQLQEDLDSMISALNSVHPGLYRYQSEKEWDNTILAARQSISEEMTLHDAYKVFSKLVASIRCAHTTLVPGDNWSDTLQKARFFFPFQLYFTGGESYILINRSPDHSVKPGSKVLTINNRKVEDIVSEIFSHLFSDGYITSLKYRQIHNVLFSYYYNCFIEQADSFTIRYIDNRGEAKQTTVAALSLADITKNTRENTVNRHILHVLSKEKEYDRHLIIDSRHSTARLILKSFFGGAPQEARNKFIAYMDDVVAQLEKKQIRRLIVDLRFNPGGYDNQGQVLLSYFLKSPVLYYQSMHTVTVDSRWLAFSSLSTDDLQLAKTLNREPDGRYQIPLAYNKTLDSVYPSARSFKGKTYFLINGGTGSSAAEFTAVAKALQVGVFVGEESGGSYTGGNSGEFVSFLLPNTGMRLTMPIIAYQNAVSPMVNKGRGTIPDYDVPYKVSDILSGKDTQLEYLTELIRKANY